MNRPMRRTGEVVSWDCEIPDRIALARGTARGAADFRGGLSPAVQQPTSQGVEPCACRFHAAGRGL